MLIIQKCRTLQTALQPNQVCKDIHLKILSCPLCIGWQTQQSRTFELCRSWLQRRCHFVLPISYIFDPPIRVPSQITLCPGVIISQNVAFCGAGFKAVVGGTGHSYTNIRSCMAHMTVLKTFTYFGSSVFPRNYKSWIHISRSTFSPPCFIPSQITLINA